MKRWITVAAVFVVAAALAVVGMKSEQREQMAAAALRAEQARLAAEEAARERAEQAQRIAVVLQEDLDVSLERGNDKAAELIKARKKSSGGPIGIDLAYWQSQNRAIVGYLYSPGTVISYPIIQGSDNNFYLDHDIYGNPDINGCIMLEHLNASDFSDNNSIIYGHHMKAGTMLASIDRYKNASFYPNHSYMYLYTPTQTYRLDLIAGYSCPADDEVFATGLTDDQISRFKAKSTFKTNLTDTSGPYVTLCTCSYEHENWRYVVICKKVAI